MSEETDDLASDAGGAAESSTPDDSIGMLLRQARPSSPDASGMRKVRAQREDDERPKLPKGDIEILRKLGGGSMGTVYEASHAGSPVALKILNNLTPQQLYSLKKEFRSLADLSHPNVVTVYQLFADEDCCYFTMEKVAGVTLGQHWRKLHAEHAGAEPGATSYARGLDGALRELLGQLIEGVAATHRAGLVHRDLKPANVLVEQSGRLVIVDFGLVSDQEAGGIGQTVERAIAGTPAYMAPEQACGLPCSPASDWYAVGVMLYELLTGQLPIQGSMVEVLTAKQESVPDAPSCVVRTVPPDLDELCRALMHKDASRRPNTDQMLAMSRTWQVDRPRAPREPFGAQKLERFVGRREVLAELDEAYLKSRSEGPLFVLIEGDSGIGKGALLDHFVANLQRTGQTFVLRGRCYEQETVPHKALDGVIDHLTRILLRLPTQEALQLAPRHVYALTRLFPVLLRVASFREAAAVAKPPADSAQLRRHGYEAVRELLCRIADRRSLVIVIDDLHWGDDDSMRLLIDTLSPPDAARLLLVASYRSDVGGRIAQLRERSACLATRHIRLDKLSDAEARSLAADILDADFEQTSALADAIAREADGMPLYVVELARLARAAGCSNVNSVAELIQGRIEQLPEAPRSVLEVVCAAGRPLSRALLASASEQADLHESLAVLGKARLIRAVADEPSDEYVDAYHHRARQACLETMTEARVRACRKRLIAALETCQGEQAEWLSELHGWVGERSSAARHAVEAAHRANAVLAFNRAAELFARAIEYLGTAAAPSSLAELHELRARALANAGRPAEAAQAYSRAASVADGYQVVRLESAANLQWMRSGHLREAVAGLQCVLEKAGLVWPEKSGEAHARLLLNRTRNRLFSWDFKLHRRAEVAPALLDQLDALYAAQTALGMIDYVRGAYFASVALPLALRAGEPSHLVSALMSESVYSVMFAGERGRPHSDKVRAKLSSVAGAVSEGLAHAIVPLSEAMAAYWEGSWGDVGELANVAAESFATEVHDGTWEATLARSIRNTTYLHAGKLGPLRGELQASARDADARDNLYASLDVRRSLATIYLMDDDEPRASRELRELEQQVARIPLSPMHVLMTSSLVALHLYGGRCDEAKQRLEAALHKSAQMHFLRFPLVRVMLLAMQADCVASDPHSEPQEKAAALHALAKNARSEPIRWAGALCHSLTAQAELFGGRAHIASVQSEYAIAGYRRHGLLIDAAVERLRSAPLAAEGTGAHSAARSQLKTAGFKAPERWIPLIRSIL